MSLISKKRRNNTKIRKNLFYKIYFNDNDLVYNNTEKINDILNRLVYDEKFISDLKILNDIMNEYRIEEKMNDNLINYANFIKNCFIDNKFLDNRKEIINIFKNLFQFGYIENNDLFLYKLIEILKNNNLQDSINYEITIWINLILNSNYKLINYKDLLDIINLTIDSINTNEINNIDKNNNILNIYQFIYWLLNNFEINVDDVYYLLNILKTYRDFNDLILKLYFNMIFILIEDNKINYNILVENKDINNILDKLLHKNIKFDESFLINKFIFYTNTIKYFREFGLKNIIKSTYIDDLLDIFYNTNFIWNNYLLKYYFELLYIILENYFDKDYLIKINNICFEVLNSENYSSCNKKFILNFIHLNLNDYKEFIYTDNFFEHKLDILLKLILDSEDIEIIKLILEILIMFSSNNLGDYLENNKFFQKIINEKIIINKNKELENTMILLLEQLDNKS